MGVMGKLIPTGRSKPKDKAPPFVSPSNPTVEAMSSAAMDYLSTVDTPTVFTTFMTFYLGFFGLTLFAYPYAFAADGMPFPNPMAYWTTMTADMAFPFRIAGTGFLVLVVGPYLDEITGYKPAGVTMKAFTFQMVVANTITFFLFLYFTFWAPLETAVPLMWMAQTFIAALVFGWSLVEISDESLLSKYNIFSAVYYGGFSLGLLTVPDLLFGPPSPFKYWENWPTIAVMTARFLGSVMLCVMVGGYYLYGMGSEILSAGFGKMATTWNVLIGLTFIIPAFFGQGSAVTNMWQIQFALQLPIIIIGLYLVFSGATGPTGLSTLCPPKFGANCATFNLIAFVWLAGFIPVMWSDPNMVMGPEPITGFPMFLEPIEETGKFFGKAWAIAVLVLILGPYLYGFSHLDAAKQTTASFALFCCIFAPYLYFYSDLFNPVTMIPLASTNFLIFCFGLYSVLTAPPPGVPGMV